jgi:hypothetical protein
MIVKKVCDFPPENCPHMAHVADIAVKKVFAILGVDVNVPREVEQFRDNLRFGATLHEAANKGLLAMIGAVSVVVLAAVWAGIMSFIVKGH